MEFKVGDKVRIISKKDGDIPLAIVCELHIMIVTLQ